MSGPKQQKSPENHFSLLVMPDEKESELYFWYRGNPLGLSRESSAIVGMDDQVLATEPTSHESKEIVATMARVSENIGYLVAKRDYLVVKVPTKRWNKLAHELLQFFPEGHSAVHRVVDETKEIAGTEDIRKRMRRVRAAEGPFATARAPEISAFRIPAQETEVPPEISNIPVYEESERAAA